MARWGRWVVVSVVGVAGAIGGAIWDWYNWHPMSAVAATLVAIPLVLLGVVMLLVRTRRSRQLGGLVLALGLGIVAGQVLGPSRPDIDGSSGLVTVALTSPIAETATASVSCTYDTEGQFQVSGDPNMRLRLGPDDPTIPADVDGRPFVSVHITSGDRWPADRSKRADAHAVSIHVDYVIEQPGVVMVATDASSLEVTGTAREGQVTFGALERSTLDGTGAPVDLAGTITWSCRPSGL